MEDKAPTHILLLTKAGKFRLVKVKPVLPASKRLIIIDYVKEN